MNFGQETHSSTTPLEKCCLEKKKHLSCLKWFPFSGSTFESSSGEKRGLHPPKMTQPLCTAWWWPKKAIGPTQRMGFRPHQRIPTDTGSHVENNKKGHYIIITNPNNTVGSMYCIFIHWLILFGKYR